MGQETDAFDAASGVSETDRRALTELLCRPVTGWDAANLEADRDRVGAMFQRQVLQETVEAVLAAGWRPPAAVLSTEKELARCRPGTIVTDRDGHPWVLNEAGQWCEPLPTGILPAELLQRDMLTRQLHVGVAR